MSETRRQRMCKLRVAAELKKPATAGGGEALNYDTGGYAPQCTSTP